MTMIVCLIYIYSVLDCGRACDRYVNLALVGLLVVWVSRHLLLKLKSIEQANGNDHNESMREETPDNRGENEEKNKPYERTENKTE